MMKARIKYGFDCARRHRECSYKVGMLWYYMLSGGGRKLATRLRGALGTVVRMTRLAACYFWSKPCATT
jgi:hypothetical protein